MKSSWSAQAPYFSPVRKELMRQAASKKMQGLRYFRFIPLFFLIKKWSKKIKAKSCLPAGRDAVAGPCLGFSSAEIAVVKISALEHFWLNVMQGGMNCPG